MTLNLHLCDKEEDFWRARNFLREVFPLKAL
jgi:hypothetical protein